MKRIYLTSVIILMFLLLLCGSALGDAKRDVPEKTIVTRPEKVIDLTLRMQPWPTRRCNPARTGRSLATGPGFSLVETASADLFGGVLEYDSSLTGGGIMGGSLDEAIRAEALDGLLIGFNNMLYFRYTPVKAFFAFSIPGGQVWSREEWGYFYPGINLSGYVIGLYNGNYKLVNCIKNDETLVWGKQIMGERGPYGFFAVGKRVYVDGLWDKNQNNEDIFHISAYDKDGYPLWFSGAQLNNIHTCAEDAQGNAYFRDASPALLRINPDGSEAWRVPFHIEAGDDYTDMGIGPICGADGRIWVCSKDESAPRRIGSGLPYIVLNSDGSKYKSGGFGDKGTPASACYGGDNRLYVGFYGTEVTCFDDWNQEIWSTTMYSGGKEILDMVMDKDNVIYVVYAAVGAEIPGLGCYLSVLDPVDGSVKKTLLLNIPPEWSGSLTELAIGEDGKLFLLNSAGYLKEFSRLILIDTSGGNKFIKVQ